MYQTFIRYIKALFNLGTLIAEIQTELKRLRSVQTDILEERTRIRKEVNALKTLILTDNDNNCSIPWHSPHPRKKDKFTEMCTIEIRPKETDENHSSK